MYFRSTTYDTQSVYRAHPEYDDREDGCLDELVDDQLDRRRGGQRVGGRWMDGWMVEQLLRPVS